MPSYIKDDLRVEVLENDCWWRGVIYDRFESPLSKEEFFEIYFPNTKTLNPFSRSQLRLAQEWIGGQWIPAESY